MRRLVAALIDSDLSLLTIVATSHRTPKMILLKHMRESEKVMFEIYREASYNRRYKVVYFTELNEHNKETEINRAMSGEYFCDGFLLESKKEEGKAVIERVLSRLNDGQEIRPEEFERELAEYTA